MSKIRSLFVCIVALVVFANLSSVFAQSKDASLTDATSFVSSTEACARFTLHVSGEKGREVRVSVFPQYSYSDEGIVNIGTTVGTTPTGHYLTKQEVLPVTYDNSRFDDLEYCFDLNYFPISQDDYQFYFYVEVADEATNDQINWFEFKPLIHKGTGYSSAMRIQNVSVDALTDGIYVTFSLYTYGFKGKTLDANVYPKYAANGQQIKTTSKIYDTKAGYLVGSTDLEALYPVSYWVRGQGGNGVSVFIPYSAFPVPTRSSGYDVAFDVQVFDGSDAVVSLDLSSSKYVVNIHPA